MSDTIRNPIQQRSIDKKNRIIQAGYDLFAEKGYFNTNTAEIAKKAGVSTGIVYGYFHDKRDILVEVLDLYTNRNYEFIFKLFNDLKAPIDFEKILGHIADKVVNIHKENSAIHEALYSLSAYDDIVNSRFMQFEWSITESICKKLRELGYDTDDLTERVHMAMELVQSYAHECVYDKHKYIHYDRMRSLIIKSLTDIFKL